jgi:hypothetical protein
VIAIYTLLVLLSLSFIAILWSLDLAEDRRSSGAYRASARQRRQWRQERRRAGWR